MGVHRRQQRTAAAHSVLPGGMATRRRSDQGPAGTGFHDLRHYASLLIRHGESIKVVQARLGHATAAETLDTYAHLWPDSEDQTRAAIDSVLGTSGAPSVPRKEGTTP